MFTLDGGVPPATCVGWGVGRQLSACPHTALGWGMDGFAWTYFLATCVWSVTGASEGLGGHACVCQRSVSACPHNALGGWGMDFSLACVCVCVGERRDVRRSVTGASEGLGGDACVCQRPVYVSSQRSWWLVCVRIGERRDSRGSVTGASTGLGGHERMRIVIVPTIE